MQDRDFAQELDSLDEVQEQNEPVGVSGTARSVESTGLFDDLGARQTIDRGAASDDAREASSSGVFGSWDTLNEAGRADWIKGERSSAQASQKFWENINDTVVKPLAARKPTGPAFVANGPTFSGLASGLTGWADRKVGENIARQKRRQFLADRMESGDVEAAKIGTTRNVVEQFSRGLFETGVGNMVGGAGRLLEYVGEPSTKAVLPSMRNTALGLVTTGKTLKHFGDWISEKAREYFPADDARQEEFSSQLAQGAGSMVAFLGPSITAAVLTKAGPKTLAAMADNPALAAEFAKRQARVGMGTAASLGASMEGESLAREAEDAQKRGKPVTDADVRTAFLLGLPLGATEALPIGNLFTAPEGAIVRNVLRELFEEGGQEFGQRVGDNFVAQSLYDPERKWDDGAWEAGAIGAILGGHMEVSRRAYAKLRAKGPVTDAGEGAAPKQAATTQDEPLTRTIDLDQFSPVGLQNAPQGETQAPVVGTPEAENATPRSNAGQETAIPAMVASEVAKGDKGGPSGAPAAIAAPDLDAAVSEVASAAHDDWRSARPKMEDGSFEPRIKPSGDTTVDIANTPYADLPVEWQTENKASAQIAVNIVSEAVKSGVPLDDALVENVADVLHHGWVQRNGSWASEELKKPYAELPEVEKEKDRLFARRAIDAVTRRSTQQNTQASFIERIANVNRKAKLAALAEEAGLSLPDEVFSGSLKDIKSEIVKAVEAKQSPAEALPVEPAPETVSDLPQRFADVVAGKSSSKTWAKSLGISQAELQPLIDEAVKSGSLRLDRNGAVRRTGKPVQSTAEPVAVEGSVTPSPEQAGQQPDRTAAIAEQSESLKPTLPRQNPPSLSIPADIRIDRSVQKREAKTGKPVPSVVVDYALQIEEARGNAELFHPIIEAIKADRLMKKSDVHDLAYLVGYPASKSTTKQDALATVVKRHGQALLNQGMSLFSLASKPGSLSLGVRGIQATGEQGAVVIDGVHYTTNNFDSFDLTKMGEGGDAYGRAVYSTPMDFARSETANRADGTYSYGSPFAEGARSIPTRTTLKKPFEINIGIDGSEAKWEDLRTGLNPFNKWRHDMAPYEAHEAGLYGSRAEAAAAFNKALEARGYDGFVVNLKGKPVEVAAIRPGAVTSPITGETLFSIGGIGSSQRRDSGLVNPALEFTQAFEESLPEFVDSLRGFLEQVLPRDVAYRLTDRIFIPRGPDDDVTGGRELYGSYQSGLQLLELALRPLGRYSPAETFKTAKHEVIHALRMLGLFTDKEWTLIVNHAKQSGVEKQMTLMDADGNLVSAVEHYQAFALEQGFGLGLNGAELEAFINEMMDQELVAKMAEDWFVGKEKQPSVIKKILDKIAKFFEALHNASAEFGFQTADDVFQKVFSGEVASRDGRREPTLGSYLASLAGPGMVQATGEQGAGAGALTLASIARSHGFPANAVSIHSFTIDSGIKSDVDYTDAKAGDQEASARLVDRLVRPEDVAAAKATFGPDVVYVPVVAEEATGKNKIPEMLAHFYAMSTGARVADDIVQTSRVYHTGARPMERMFSRALFDGPVEPGRAYVLVDDVTVMGGTLAELANHIQSNGGVVSGVVTLVNASRTGQNAPHAKDIVDIATRFGNTIRDEFGIEPSALTADEAFYLRGFRDADALRNSIAKAKRERVVRLRAKGLLPPESEGGPVLASVARIGPFRAVNMGDTRSTALDAPEQRLSDIVKSVVNALGLTVRSGRLDPGLKRSASARGNEVAGQFSGVTGVVRVAMPNDLATLAHEGGHALEVRPSIKNDLGALKQKHVDELAGPVVTNGPAPQFTPSGFSGLEIDAETQSLAGRAAVADKEWRRQATIVGAAKSRPGLTGAVKFDQAAYQAAQDEAALSRAMLIRRLGRQTADAVIADITKADPAGMAGYLAQRYSATGTPLPRAPVTATPLELSEGFAEWFRIYLTNPTEANAVAPEFFVDFENMLDGTEPQMLVALQEIQTQVQALAEASPVGAVRSRIQSTVIPGRFGALREEVAEKGLGATISEKLYELYRAFADTRHPAKRQMLFLLGTAAENLDVKLQAKERLVVKTMDDFYRRWRLSEHAKVHATAALQDGIVHVKSGAVDPTGPSYWDALVKAFGGKSKGQWIDEKAELFGSYLVARRMLAEFGRFDRGELEHAPDQVIGRDIWVAAKAQLEKAHPEFMDAAILLYQFNQNVLRLKFENGFFTQELYDDLKGRADYVPLKRIMDDGTPTGLIKARGNNKRKLIYKFQGSTRDFINPLESIAQDMYATMGRVAQNDTVSTMDRMARAVGPGGGAIAERLPASEMKGTTMDLREAVKAAARADGISQSDREGLLEIIDDIFDEDASATIFRATEINERGEQIVYLWEDGKKVPIRLGDNQMAKDVFETMVALGQNNSNMIMDVMSLGTQALRFGTTKALVYNLINLLRDQFQVWSLSGDFIPFYTGFKGLRSVLKNDEAAKRYNAFAGMMGGIDTLQIERSARKHDVLSLRRRGFWSVAAPSTLGQWWQTILRTMEIAEAGTRVGHFDAVFNGAVKDQITPEQYQQWLDSNKNIDTLPPGVAVAAVYEAAYMALDVMPFDRRGAQMGGATRLVPFLNAQIQGLDVARRTMTGERNTYKNYRELASPYLKAATGSPLSIAEKQALPLSAGVWVKMASVGLIGLALSAWYRDDPEHEEFDDYMRSTHWFFKDPTGALGTWMRWPKHFELASISNLFEAAFARYWKDDERAWKFFRKSMRQTMMPPGEIPFLKIQYEWMTGKDTFRDRPIIPQDLAGLPPEMQFSAYTSEFAKMVGKVTGLAPVSVDHVIGGLFSTLGREGLAISDYVLPRANQAMGGILPGVATEPRAEKSTEDQWFLSRVTRRASRGALSTQEFWDQMAEDGGKFAAAAKGYKDDRFKSNNLRQARDRIKNLPDEQKAYAYLEGEFTEKDQDMHPLNRARQVMSTASGIRRDMVMGRLVKQSTEINVAHKLREPDAIVVPPSAQRIVNETLEAISMREARNALILIGQPGWKQKEIVATDGLWAELRQAVPDVAEEFEARLSSSRKIYSFEGIQKVWPEARDRLIKDGPEAILVDLRAEAAYGGNRVEIKEPPRAEARAR